MIDWDFGMLPVGSFLSLLHRVSDGLATCPALYTKLRGAVTRCSCCPLQSTAPAALPVTQLMMHIQRPLPISSNGDFSVIHGLRCIQLNKEHVLCTAEINLYQGLNCQVWRREAGWAPVSFPVFITSACRTGCGSTYSTAIRHSLIYCCPCLAPATVALLAIAVKVNFSVWAPQAALGRHCWPISTDKGAVACWWVCPVFWWVTWSV